MARHLSLLATALSERHDVEILTQPDAGGFTHLPEETARLVETPYLGTSLSPRHLWRAFGTLRQYLNNADADLYWFHARLPVLLVRFLLLLRLWKPDAPIVLTFHGLPFDRGHWAPFRTISLVLERFLLSRCPPLHLVFLTERARQTFIRSVTPWRLRRHRLHVLENGSDLGPLPAPLFRTGRRIVMTARAAWQKDLHKAARLMRHLPEDVQLTLCGPETDSPRFCDEIAALVPRETLARIRCIGSVTDVRPVLAQADAFLLTSRYEGMPIGLLEAFEAGLPVALADFEGARDFVSLHPQAMLLPFENPRREAQRLVAMIDDYTANRAALSQRIHGVWAQRWSRAQFDAAALGLVEEVAGAGQSVRMAAE
jgi:glycosyltransferase involved in cell wall biosynthesis